MRARRRRVHFSHPDWNAVDILLAEDKDADAELTVRALRKIGVANKLLRVRDGIDAINFVFRGGQFVNRDHALPKLILLDVSMPAAGGLEVLRRLKESKTTRDIPVGILTASEKDTDFFKSQELLVWDYLLKPVNEEELLDLVREAEL